MPTIIKTHMQETDIYLDGSLGEGGGQILRSALSLSAITGKSFQLDQIRAGRKRSGLMRQHLTCVQAAATLCDANISDVSVGSSQLRFSPGKIRGGQHRFSIGTAGSTSLLLQTILPILLAAEEESEVTLQGGTHALQSPSFQYINEIFLPQVQSMGARADLELVRPGFFPAGGGEIKLSTKPSRLSPIKIHERNGPTVVTAEVINTPEIPHTVAEKELNAVRRRISLEKESTRLIEKCQSPGNVLVLRASAEPADCPGTLVSFCGEKNKSSEQVAKEAVREMKRYLNSPSPVDEHLADQLLLPLALAGGGGFTAANLTPHFYSNLKVIELFLPIKITSEQLDRFAWKIELLPIN